MTRFYSLTGFSGSCELMQRKFDYSSHRRFFLGAIFEDTCISHRGQFEKRMFGVKSR